MDYLTSVLDAYEHVLRKSINYGGSAASKVKQEILHGLGNVLNMQNSSSFFFLVATFMHDTVCLQRIFPIKKYSVNTCVLLNFSNFAGELYVQAQMMFDDRLYTQLLGIIELAVKQTNVANDNFENEFVSELSRSIPITIFLSLTHSSHCMCLY